MATVWLLWPLVHHYGIALMHSPSTLGWPEWVATKKCKKDVKFTFIMYTVSDYMPYILKICWHKAWKALNRQTQGMETQNWLPRQRPEVEKTTTNGGGTGRSDPKDSKCSRNQLFPHITLSYLHQANKSPVKLNKMRMGALDVYTVCRDIRLQNNKELLGPLQ